MTSPFGVQAPQASLPTIQTQSLGAAQEVDFNADIKIVQLERFPKMTLNQVVRFAFVCFNAEGHPKLKMIQSFFNEQAKWGCRAPTHNKQLMQDIQARLGEAKTYFHTIICVYDTDAVGNVLSNRTKLFSYKFSTDKWPTYKLLHSQWGLQNHDLFIQCTEPTFQKATINPAKDRMILAAPELNKAILEEAEGLYNVSMERHLAQVRTDEEIIQFLQAFDRAKNGGGMAPNSGLANNFGFTQNQQPAPQGQQSMLGQQSASPFSADTKPAASAQPGIQGAQSSTEFADLAVNAGVNDIPAASQAAAPVVEAQSQQPAAETVAQQPAAEQQAPAAEQQAVVATGEFIPATAGQKANPFGQESAQ